MMAIFFAQRVVLGTTAFTDVPPALKHACAAVLCDNALPELVPLAFGGTATDVAK